MQLDYFQTSVNTSNSLLFVIDSNQSAKGTYILLHWDIIPLYDGNR